MSWVLGCLSGRPSLELSHPLISLLALSLSGARASKPKHYSLPHSSFDFTLRSPSVSRRIGRGASPRHRLRVDAKIVDYGRGCASRVGKLTRFEVSGPYRTNYLAFLAWF